MFTQSLSVRRSFPLVHASALAFSSIGLPLLAGSPAQAQGPGFHVSSITSSGVIALDSHVTYYDGSDGTLFTAIALPAGATSFQFRATGGVITDGSLSLGSPDGLYSNGQTPYNFNNTQFSGTYQGKALGSTTGIDPALFGVFFSPTFAGTPQDSLNYRSDSGTVPDPRTLTSYAPTVNQPFYIGDGYTGNNAYITTDDTLVPAGMIQTFQIPAGASSLLLGIGADIKLGDNQGGAKTSTGYNIHVYDNAPIAAVPEASTTISLGLLLMLGLSGVVVTARKKKLSA